MFVDTHSHISKTDDAEGIIRRAKEVGVEKIILAGTNLEDSKYNLELSEKYPELYASVGIYPHEEMGKSAGEIREELERVVILGRSATTTPESVLTSDSGRSRLRSFARMTKLVAIGECGLDYKETARSPQEQKKLFRAQIQLASKYKLPLIIHSRDSYEDIIQELKKYNRVIGVFHCFVGDEDVAKEVLNLNFYLSFTGIVTYKSAKYLENMIKNTPLDRILLETDSPFLVPEPLRSEGIKINEPKNVTMVANKIAQIKDVSLQEIAIATQKNATELFKL